MLLNFDHLRLILSRSFPRHRCARVPSLKGLPPRQPSPKGALPRLPTVPLLFSLLPLVCFLFLSLRGLLRHQIPLHAIVQGPGREQGSDDDSDDGADPLRR